MDCMNYILISIIITLMPLSSCSGTTNVQKKGSRDIQASEIIAQLDNGKHVYMDSCIIWGDLDFTRLRDRNRIASNLTRVFVNQSVSFNECTFMGEVKGFDTEKGVSVEFMYNLSFIGCDFQDDVDFTEITVRSNAFFSNSVFRGKANMQGAYFWHKKVYFSSVIFEGDALFQNVIFMGDAYFLHTNFSMSAMFQKTNAMGLLFFGNTSFNGYADFTYARALKSIFNYSEFYNRYDFGSSQLNAEGLHENILNK